MAKWSIARAAMAAALVSVAAMPALAQDGWAPPPQDDGGWRQSGQDDGARQGYDGQDSSSPATDEPQSAPDQQDESDQATDDEGFASRDAAPPDSTVTTPSEDKGWSDWHSDPQSPREPEAAAGDQGSGVPETAPGTVNSFNQPEATPGFQATTGIANRNQAVSACLAAVRSRVSGGAGAARVDGINGEWMVSGAVDDGRAFYCAIHDGAVDDIQFGS
jgi:hypothetical protein